MSSASRTGSCRGTSSAATETGSVVVRAVIAAARTMGDGRYPSSEAWCSESTAAAAPCSSPHAAISRAAAYSSSVVAGPELGARMSNRIMNTDGSYGADPRRSCGVRDSDDEARSHRRTEE